MKRHASRNRSAQHIERYFKTELVPVLGSKPAAKVTRADLVDLFDAIVDRGSPVTANRVFANTRALFNWAVGRGAVEQNPLSGMQMPAEEKSRDRVLNSEEIAWLWEATKEIGSPFGPLYRLLLLTGQRLREVAHMSTTEIDGNVWTIPGARAKNGEPHAVPLSPLALETIKDVRMTCDTGIFLFTTNGETPVSGFAKAKSRLDKAMKRLASEKAATPVTIEPFVIHDLRRTVASGMAELGVAPHVCEAVLNHRSGTVSGVARVYNRHDYAVEKRGALEAWANCVAAIIENNSDPDAGRSRASQ
jgi:integrase